MNFERDKNIQYLRHCRFLFTECAELISGIGNNRPINEWTDEELEDAVGIVYAFIAKLKAPEA